MIVRRIPLIPALIPVLARLMIMETVSVWLSGAATIDQDRQNP
jgi:hypothetical protein